MVERNLAKVEVESSRLFSRSNLKGSTSKCCPFSLENLVLVFSFSLRDGAVTKRLCTGLQIRLARFDSGPRLQIHDCNVLFASHLARVVKSVDTADLKSAASFIAGVPVRFRSRAPSTIRELRRTPLKACAIAYCWLCIRVVGFCRETRCLQRQMLPTHIREIHSKSVFSCQGRS